MKTVLLTLCFFVFYFQIYAQGFACKEESKIHLVQDLYGLTGDGVITIMMDRGIDYRHPDFIDEQGKTRILYIYDLYDDSGASDPDNPYGVGTIFDQQEINNALQNGGTPLVNDIFGHGTATTGIMSGNGSGVNDSSIFGGVAPNEDIISIIVLEIMFRLLEEAQVKSVLMTLVYWPRLLNFQKIKLQKKTNLQLLY